MLLCANNTIYIILTTSNTPSILFNPAFDSFPECTAINDGCYTCTSEGCTTCGVPHYVNGSGVCSGEHQIDLGLPDPTVGKWSG